jgi:hypothetical protein
MISLSNDEKKKKRKKKEKPGKEKLDASENVC